MNERLSLLEGRPFYYKIFVLIILILTGTTVIGGLGYFTVSNLFGLSPEYIAEGLSNSDAIVSANALRILQVFFSLGMFFVPALAYSQISKTSESQFFGFKNKIPTLAWVSVLVLMIAVSPFVDGLVYLNYNLPYPDFMSGFMDNLIAQQELVSGQMESLVAMPSFTIFLFNILIIAVIPAIGEEWLFRGVIQKLFKERFNGIHVSIWLTAFFFALLHQSVFFFLGLWILGAILGYLKEWSGNIWLPVFAHFLNNSLVLFVTYFFPDLIGDLDDVTFEFLPFILSLIGTAGLLAATYYILTKTSSNAEHLQTIEEEI